MKVANEISFTGFGKPRGHDAFFSQVRDLAGVRFDVAVGQKRKRSRFAGMMAGSASAKNDGSEIFVEGDAFFRARVRGGRAVKEVRTGESTDAECDEESFEAVGQGVHSRSEM